MDNYEDILAYLYDQLPMYQNQGQKAIKKDLTNIRNILAVLDSPHTSYPCIHVAGTNGKGTTSHLLSAIFMAQGLKVGLYTSPHYVDFRERIKVNGKLAAKDFITNFVKDMAPTISMIHPSFFEITVAMAFAYFRAEHVDIAIIETGLGGRLDSTNVLDPLLSVITNISLDHTDVLGSDEYSIAGEKAGIIKQNRPVVIGKYQNSCDHIFINKAASMNAQISFASLNWNVKEIGSQYSFSRKKESKVYNVNPGDFSPFIVENITTALEAVYCFNEHYNHKIDDKSIRDGINKYKELSNYTGRWQILGQRPLIIADSAHNLSALRIITEHLKKGNYKRMHFILGFVKGKDVQNILGLFDHGDAFYFTRPSIDRGLPVHELGQIAEKAGMHGILFEHVEEAIMAAKKSADPDDLIYIGGSSFVVSDALNIGAT